ncbi:MAG: hypothetical protein IPO80_04985 [Propionibacteriaceae bacterium]|nr:hypothetical protein [Propionibacteriaceae bacterium]
MTRAERELHDEITAWLDTLAPEEWERVVVVVDRLAQWASTARLPPRAALGRGPDEL